MRTEGPPTVTNRHSLESTGATLRTGANTVGVVAVPDQRVLALRDSLKALAKSGLRGLSGWTCWGTLSEQGPAVRRSSWHGDPTGAQHGHQTGKRDGVIQSEQGAQCQLISGAKPPDFC